MTGIREGVLILRLTTLLTISLWTLPVAVAESGDCANPLDLQSCQDLNHGSVVVSDGARKRVASASAHEGKTGRAARQQADQAASAQFCFDASANAVAGGAVTQETAALCRGIVALPVGPGRDDIVRAFEELPLYKGAIRTEPSRWTLVNLETYFWCGDSGGTTCDVLGEGEQRVTLLGQQLRIRPRITAYSWSFGDGSTAEVATGKATHTYRHAGERTVTLTLTWTADYALGTGGFQPIDDTTTTTSAPRVLPVHEAQTVIVGGD